MPRLAVLIRSAAMTPQVEKRRNARAPAWVEETPGTEPAMIEEEPSVEAAGPRGSTQRPHTADTWKLHQQPDNIRPAICERLLWVCRGE